MPMNEQPPWGKKKQPGGPEDLLAALIQKIRDAFAGREKEPPQGPAGEPPPERATGPFSGPGKVVAIVAAFIVLQAAAGAFYTIKPGEVGIVLRFGQFHRTTTPGLHFKIPYVEEMTKVDVESVRKEEFGFRTRTATAGAAYDRKGFDMEALMLTGDKDVIEVAWIVQYKVSDPVLFLYKVRDVAQIVRDASETVTRRIVGNMDFDYVLSNREILAANARKELQGQLDRLESGVNVLTLQLLDINPPEQQPTAMAYAGLGAMIGPLCAAYCATRWGWWGTTTGAYALKAVAIGLPLVWAGFGGHALSGFVVGALSPGMAAITSGYLMQLIGPGQHKKMWGYATAAFALLQASSGYLMAFVYASSGSYRQLFVLGCAALLLGTLLVIFSKSKPVLALHG